MRICLINYRYFVSSGPERYLFGVKELLEARGHEVIPFSVRYSRNEPTPWADYFVPPIAGEDEVRFRQHSWSVSSVRRALERAFYSPEVHDALARLLRDARPDVAYVLHYMRKLSPAVLVALHEAAVPTVVRFSDFAMVCPQAHMVRDDRICELCVHRGPWPSVPFRCVQGSLGASAVNAVAMEWARRRGYFGLVDAFVAPSRIMVDKMVEGGLPASRLHHLPTFVRARAPRPFAERARRVCYVGRIERIKGLVTLFDAWEMLYRDGMRDVELVLAGRPRHAVRPLPGAAPEGAAHPRRHPCRAARRGRRRRAPAELAALGGPFPVVREHAQLAAREPRLRHAGDHRRAGLHVRDDLRHARRAALRAR